MFKKLILSLVLFSGLFGATAVGLKNPEQIENQIYIFSMQNCKYCTILKEDVLSDPAIIKGLNKIKVYYLDREKVSNTVLQQWKIKGFPTVVAVQRLDKKSVKIVEYWQLKGVSRDRKYKNNKASFLKFLNKYSEKNT